MKILITGGCGFIGSNLVEALYKENEIIVIDNLSTGRLENLNNFNENIQFINADISENKEKWEFAFDGVDRVFHLAALADIVPSIQNPDLYFRSNVLGTLNVIQAAVKYKVNKFIYSASSSCYGIPGKYPTNEKSEIKPQYPYALTKRLGEELVLHWAKVFKLPAISLRFFNVYGQRSRTSGTYGAMFGVFLAQKLANHPLTVIGDGNQTRDFTYVTDVCDAMIKASDSDFIGEIFNVGSGDTVSVNMIVDLLGGNKVFIPKRPGEPDCTYADIDKIKKMLNWQPKINIKEGVALLLQNIDYWKNAPVWEPKSIENATRDWFKYLS
jgi:UDP-glucose 4-epimerase